MSLTRRLSLLALVLAGLLGLAACAPGQGGAAAITVNGESISVGEFNDELRTYQDEANQIVLDSLQQQASGQGLAVEEGGSGALPAGVVANIATSRVVYLLVAEELDERGIEVSDEDVAALRSELLAPATDPSTGQPSGQPSQFDGLSDAFVDQFAEDQALVEALREAALADGGAEVPEPTDEEVQGLIDASGEQTCLTGAITDDEAAAEDVVARVQAGEQLEALASELDPAAGDGELGCLSETGSAELDEALAALEVGEVGPPIELPAETGGGFLVVRVDQRGPLSEDDAREQLRQQAEQAAAQQDPLAPIIEAALAEADIEVASRYGRWDAERLAVVPPEGPVPADTSVPLAIDPATGAPPQDVPAEGG